MERDYKSHALPPEILTLILSHLPVKSLLRFRSVSREWKSIIDSPDFTSLHLSCYSNNRLETNLIVVEKLAHLYTPEDRLRAQCFRNCPVTRNNRQTTEFDFSVPAEYVSLGSPVSITVGAVDGLLLMQTRRDGILWNPSIRKVLTIPRPPSLSSILHLSIGFDPSTNDYKVVSIVDDEQSLTLDLEIFSLNSRSWRKGRSFALDCKVRSLATAWSKKVYSQGSVHWVAKDYEGGGAFDKAFVSLNLISETLSYTRIPNTFGKNSIDAPIAVAGGLILNTRNYCIDTPIAVAGGLMGLLIRSRGGSDIWVLEMDGRWSKRFRIDLHSLPVEMLLPSRLYLNKHGVLFFESTMDGDFEDSIYAYSTKSRAGWLVLECNQWDLFYFGAYIESLVLLN